NLFKPSGKPLRAKVKFEIDCSLSKKEEKRRKKNSSPDLTHLVRVKAGDELPMMCYRVYKDSRYYLEIARINDLTDFRVLEPGMELMFPPVE
ncbi:MAG: LysM peptidoglycan-binding domain-containing protein, partial [Pseudomonadota bacterium]